MYSLRPWTDCDAGVSRDISRAVYPEYQEEPNHPMWFPARQLGAPGEVTSRYVVVDSKKGQRIAYARLWELRPRRYRFDLAVRPEWRRQGIATQLLSRLIDDARQLGATGLQARVRDDKLEALEFIRRRGFHESHRMGAYRIDFTDARESHEFPEAFNRLRDRGIKVTNLAAVRERDSHYMTRFYKLYSAAREGWPDPDPDPAHSIAVSLATLESWLDEVQLPEVFFIARHVRRYIAFTSFFALGTAVHPEYRHQGIATLLKAGSIADAQSRGLQGQTTSTASPAMQSLFTKLGYKRMGSEIRLIRELRDET